MSAHTPAPWRFSLEGAHRAYIVDEEGFTIFTMHASPMTNQVTALAANAQLVVNAPKMLAALEALYKGIEEWRTTGHVPYTLLHHAHDDAGAVIAAAKGGA
jgi:hypothetical protein